jgi:hypothetical protein
VVFPLYTLLAGNTKLPTAVNALGVMFAVVVAFKVYEALFVPDMEYPVIFIVISFATFILVKAAAVNDPFNEITSPFTVLLKAAVPETVAAVVPS